MKMDKKAFSFRGLPDSPAGALPWTPLRVPPQTHV